MWTSTLELDPKRIFLTQLLGRFWPGAYFSFSAPLRVQNVPREALAASNWVRVRNRLAGICGSDLNLIYTKGDLRIAPAALPGRQPFYLGHEVVGEVIEIGDDVQHLRIGDRVVLQYHPNCLSSGALPLCHFCATGSYNFCERGELPGPSPLGGGWSEEMLLPEQQLFRVPDGLSDEQAVMLEPTAVALHAVLRRLPQAGERVLVIGAGTIGLLTVAMVRTFAPQARVSVLARYPFQIEQATRLGAEHIIYTQDSYQGVQQATQAEAYRGWFGNQMLLGGFDKIYDTVGSQSTLHHALRWARAGSVLVLVGSDLHLMHIDMTPIWYQEISLLGSLSHGIENWPPDTKKRRSTFDIAAELIVQHRLLPEQLITHRFALTDYQHALMTAASKSQNRAIKIVFDYALLPASVVPNVRASAPRQRRPASISEQWSSLDEPEAPEIEPPASQISAAPVPAPPQQSWNEENRPEMVEEDTQKVPAIKKVPRPSSTDKLEETRQEKTAGYGRQPEPPATEEIVPVVLVTQISPADEIEILADTEQSEVLPEQEVEAQVNSIEIDGSSIPNNDQSAPLSPAFAEEAVDARDNQEGLALHEERHEEGVLREEVQEELLRHEEYQAEYHEEIELAAQEEPSAGEHEWVEEETIGQAVPEVEEAHTEPIYLVSVESVPVVEESTPVVSAADETAMSEPLYDEVANEIAVSGSLQGERVHETAVSEPLHDEVATDTGEQGRQEETMQPVGEERAEQSIADAQALNNVDDATTLSDGKARSATRKKRATKEGSDALQQVDATIPGERKRSRPRTRKKSQVEE